MACHKHYKLISPDCHGDDDDDDDDDTVMKYDAMMRRALVHTDEQVTKNQHVM